MTELKTGEKYLTLQIGDLKIPFFPTKTKEGKKYYQTTIRIWVNEKREDKSKEKEI